MSRKNRVLNPNSITLRDIQNMSSREFRQWDFMKMNDMGEDIKKTENVVRRLDTKLWGVLVAIIITLATVVTTAIM